MNKTLVLLSTAVWRCKLNNPICRDSIFKEVAFSARHESHPHLPVVFALLFL